MNLFGFNITRARSDSANRNSKIQNQKSLSPEALAWLAGSNPGPSAPSLHNAYTQVVWVYRAINALAEQLANIPFLFSRGERGRESLITSGPLLGFYSHPHPAMNRFQYWELRVLWLMLRGECIRVPIYEDRTSAPSRSSSLASPARTGEGRGKEAPASLHHSTTPSTRRPLRQVLLLDPARFQHVVQDNQLIGWRYTGAGPQAPLDSQVFLPEEVWFERLPNPFDFWRGLSPLLVADLAAKTDFAAASYMRGIIENNAENGLIVRTDSQLSDEQHEQIAAALRNRKHCAGHADSAVVLWGATEIVHPQLSSADLQFLENRKFTRAEICAAFGVPEEIVTTTDHNKYDVMQGARLNFIENRIAPLCARLEAEEERTVKSIDPNAVGWFDLDSLPIMQQARRNRLAAAKIGFDMGIPFNEINRVLDLGFQPLPWGDRGYLPAKYQLLPPPSPAGRVALNPPPPVGRVVPNAPPPSDTAAPHHPASSNGAPAVASPSVGTHELLKLARQLKELMHPPNPPNP